MDRILQDIRFIKGVGPRRSHMLARLGVSTILDLLWYVPRSYFNRNQVSSIDNLQEGQIVSIRGRVRNTSSSRSRRGMAIFKAIIEDGTGMINAVWFNQPFLTRMIKPGNQIFLKGKVTVSLQTLNINVSEYEVLEKGEKADRVVPIYGLTEGLSQRTLRSLVEYTLVEYLDDYPEILGLSLRKEFNLVEIGEAFRNIHFPMDRKSYYEARRRLALEELLLFQLSMKKDQQELNPRHGFVKHQPDSLLANKIRSNLPYQLTPAQIRVVGEIFADMEAPLMMNRLVQGDVGSGKTIVAALAMAKAVDGGFQAALMAPTEILAQQHFRALQNIFRDVPVIIACLTGSTPAAEKKMILSALASGEINILVGTQALIQEGVYFKNLGLAVIDEQHRFGVRQRARLEEKGSYPDVLVMTATPIPRTLALTVYGDLEVSIIDELPPGRKEIKTAYVPVNSRSKAYQFVRKEIEKGRQVYVVCPLVEESENQDLQAALSLYEDLKNNIFPDIRVGILHGRMKSAEKSLVMDQFQKGYIKILVSTTVIEVGVDVPNASVMIVEQAERFGISQLHQLRGRVGRGEYQSYCILVVKLVTAEARKRIKVLVETTDGFRLAQEDLLIRGPGDFWGVKQHGLDQLKVADLSRDIESIELSKECARYIDPSDSEVLLYIRARFNKMEQITMN